MPGAIERLELLLERHQERRRLVGPQDAGRMRVEGHRGGRAAALPRPAADAVDDLHVPAVQAVEVPQRQHRRMPPRRAVVGEMGNLHHRVIGPSGRVIGSR
jgi:hypothetical protein